MALKPPQAPAPQAAELEVELLVDEG
jgi:hypothetical protein